jgi:hypothetical protein
MVFTVGLTVLVAGGILLASGIEDSKPATPLANEK